MAALAMREIEPSQAARDAKAGAVLIDVREPDEWAVGHAPGAVHLPMSGFDIAAVPSGVPIAVICRSGMRSARVAAALAERGYDAANVVGGMLAWQHAGLPVVTDDGALGDVLA